MTALIVIPTCFLIVLFDKTYYMFGELNTEEIDQLISQQVLGRIGCHANGVTYIVPVSYAYDGTCIYVHSFNGMKLDLMRKNPKVCFEVDNTKNLANWQSAICWGDFEELTEESQKKEAFEILNARILPMISSETMHMSAEWPFSADVNKAGKGLFFRYVYQKKQDDSKKALMNITLLPEEGQKNSIFIVIPEPKTLPLCHIQGNIICYTFHVPHNCSSPSPFHIIYYGQ